MLINYVNISKASRGTLMKEKNINEMEDFYFFLDSKNESFFFFLVILLGLFRQNETGLPNIHLIPLMGPSKYNNNVNHEFLYGHLLI